MSQSGEYYLHPTQVWVLRDIEYIVGIYSTSDKAEEAMTDWINDQSVPLYYRDQVYISRYELG